MSCLALLPQPCALRPPGSHGRCNCSLWQWLLVAQGELWPLGREQRSQLPQEKTEEPLLSLQRDLSHTGCTHRPHSCIQQTFALQWKEQRTPRISSALPGPASDAQSGAVPTFLQGPRPRDVPPTTRQGRGAEQQGGCNTLLGIWRMQHRIDLALMWKSLSPSRSPSFTS